MSSCARSWRDKPPQEVPNMLWETWESSFFLQSWLGDAGQGKARRMASCWLLCEVVDINKAHARALLTSRSLESRLPALAKIFTSSCLQMCCMNFYKTVGARIWDALQALVPGVTEGWCQSGSASADPRVPMASARQQCLLRRVWLLQFRGGRTK